MKETVFLRWHSNRELAGYIRAQARRHFPVNADDSDDAVEEAWARVAKADSKTGIEELKLEASRAIQAFYKRALRARHHDQGEIRRYLEEKTTGCRQTKCPQADRLGEPWPHR